MLAKHHAVGVLLDDCNDLLNTVETHLTNTTEAHHHLFRKSIP